MFTTKVVGAIALALGLMAGTLPVLAGPVLALAADGSFGNASVREGRFAEAFGQLHISGNGAVTAYLATQASQAIDIDGVFLVKVDRGGVAIESTRRSFNEVLAVDWADRDFGSERWELPSSVLSAGSWQIQVSGEGLGSKHGAAYAGAIVPASSQVPEPQTLALSLLALVAMVGLKLRIKSV